MANTLITIPAHPARGSIVEIRTLIAHPMETGHRADADGQRVPRNILRRFRCTFEGELVFEAELFPAIAANPFLAFPMRVERSGMLGFSWEGDDGFSQSETRRLELA